MNKLIDKISNLPIALFNDVRENPARYTVFPILVLITWRGSHLAMPKELYDVISQLSAVFLVLLTLSVYILATKAPEPLNSPFFTRWKTDRWCYAILLVLMVLGFIYRLLNLSILDPYTDENAHLRVAMNLTLGKTLNYERGEVIGTIISWLFNLTEPSSFRQYLFWARAPGVLVGTLTAVPLYLLAKRISGPIALIACALWLCSPWAIGISRYVREYAYFPFFILLALLSLIALIGHIKTGVRKNALLIAGHGAFLLLFTLYAFIVDPRSTMKAGFLAIAATLMWYLLTSLPNLTAQGSRLGKLLVMAPILAIIGAIYLLKTKAVIGLGFQLEPRFLNVFLWANNDTPVMWWHKYAAFDYIVLFLILVGAIFAAIRKKVDYFLFLFITLAMVFFYYLCFDRYFKPRYCFYIMPFFTIVIATGVYYLCALALSFRSMASRIIAGFLIGCFLFTVFNYKNTQLAIGNHLTSPLRKKGDNKNRKEIIANTGYFTVTGEYHQDMSDVLRYLKDKVSADDVFITTMYGPMLMMGLKVPDERIFYYNHESLDASEAVGNIIHQHKQGWIILDYRRHGVISEPTLPLEETFAIENETVSFIRERNETQLFRWKRIR